MLAIKVSRAVAGADAAASALADVFATVIA
jgi:hypothetical protein